MYGLPPDPFISGGPYDVCMAAIHYSQVESGTVHILHKGEEACDNLWQKVRSM
jgi:hypothetical protein